MRLLNKKNLKNYLLFCGVAFLLTSAYGRITYNIDVTTFVDENGENVNTCSLREAIESIRTLKSFGGCPAGQNGAANTIILKAGTYQLVRGALLVQSAIIINGVTLLKDDEVDPYTGVKPHRLSLYNESGMLQGTEIKAAANSRVFVSTAEINLKDVSLLGNGKVSSDRKGDGGIIYTSQGLSLDNVVFKNGISSGNGGSIYLSASGSNITATDVSIEASSADKSGGAIAMVCSDGLLPYATHELSFTRSLFANNQAYAGAGIIDACGDSKLSMATSTFTGNQSASNYAGINYANQGANKIGSIELSYVTATKNINNFLYADKVNVITISNSFIGFNGNSSCLPSSTLSTVSGIFNVYDDDDCKSYFQVNLDKNKKMSSASFINEFYSVLGYHGGLTKNYLPKDATSSQYVFDKGDIKENCKVNDQRNLSRQSGSACDIGAVERRVLTANSFSANSKSGTDRLVYADVLSNISMGETDAGPGDYTKVTVTPIDTTICEWKDVTIQKDVTVVKDGKTTTEQKDFIEKRLVIGSQGVVTETTSPIVCEYSIGVSNSSPVPAFNYSSQDVINNKIKVTFNTDDNTRIVIYKKLANNTEVTLIENTDYSVSKLVSGEIILTNGLSLGETLSILPDFSFAKVTSNIINQPPVAVADTYTRNVGVSSISFNPLDNDNDNDDGVYGGLRTTNSIYIASQPTLGTITGVSSGPCPDATSFNSKQCLTPPLTYIAKNADSPFTDSFQYTVYDAGSDITTFNGDGVTKEFIIPFTFTSVFDVKATVIDEFNNASVLVNITDYAIEGNKLVKKTPLPIGYKLTLQSISSTSGSKESSQAKITIQTNLSGDQAAGSFGVFGMIFLALIGFRRKFFS